MPARCSAFAVRCGRSADRYEQCAAKDETDIKGGQDLKGRCEERKIMAGRWRWRITIDPGAECRVQYGC